MDTNIDYITLWIGLGLATLSGIYMLIRLDSTLRRINTVTLLPHLLFVVGVATVATTSLKILTGVS